MTTYRCDLTILLKKDIRLPNLIEVLSGKNINKAIDSFAKTKQMHRQKGFKPYCIGAIHPIEKTKFIRKEESIGYLSPLFLRSYFLMC